MKLENNPQQEISSFPESQATYSRDLVDVLNEMAGHGIVIDFKDLKTSLDGYESR